MSINQESKKIQYFIYLKPILFLWTTRKIKKILLGFFRNRLKYILNMWFFNITNINLKNTLFILIIKFNNISKFNMLRFDLWLLYIFLDKDHKMYAWSCFHSFRSRKKWKSRKRLWVEAYALFNELVMDIHGTCGMIFEQED